MRRRWSVVARVVPRWSRFSKVGNSKILRELSKWFVIVPIIARLLVTLAREVISIPGLDFVTRLSLPHDWQLLYYSAFSFLIAGVAYELRAPRIFKDHASYFAFTRVADQKAADLVDYLLEAIGKRPSNAQRKGLLEILSASDDPRVVFEAEEQLSSIGGVEQLLHSAPFTDKERILRRYIWRFCDHSRVLSRTFCFSFYAAGFTLLGCAFASDLHIVLTQSSQTHLLEHLKSILGEGAP